VGLDYLITVEMGRASPLGRRLAAAGVDRELSASKHCYISLFLLWDRKTNPRSFFQPYYRVLPAAYPNMPVFWAPHELRWLEGSYVVQQAEDRRANIKADYEIICRAVAARGADGTGAGLGGAGAGGAGGGLDFASIATLDEFLWARMVVASRNFGIVVDGVRTDALVPYADMLNHSRPRQTRWLFDSRRRAFLIVSMQALHCGAQVFDSYGKKCNSRFLLNYGFAVDHNADDDVGQNHNEVRLLVALLPPAEDPWHARRQELLGGLALVAPPHEAPPAGAVAVAGVGAGTGASRLSAQPSRAGDLQLGSSGGGASAAAAAAASASSASLGGGSASNVAALDVGRAPQQMPARAVRISTFADYDGTVEAFSFLRFVHARGSELLQLPRMDEDFDLAKRPVAPLSCANEAAALRHLARLCAAALARYPTSLEQDRAELASGRLAYGSNQRNALVLLRGEKEVLQHFVRLAELALPLLDPPAARAHVQALVAAQELRARLQAAGAAAASGSEANAARYVAAVVLPLLQRAEAAGRQERALAIAAAAHGGGKDFGE